MAADSALKTRKKVKTGCKTCKVRRVKCDEGRPSCQRCLSTGRICDGYGIWGGGGTPQKHIQPIRKSQDITVCCKTPSSFGDVLNSDELYYLKWFRTRSMFKLPGAFMTPFWEVILIQSSVTEPAIRHAVLALSSFHCSSVLGTRSLGSPKSCHGDRTTLEQYNKAITSLTPQLSSGDAESIRIVVVACIVFVFLEGLRGRYQQARSHLEHGVLLWKEFQYKYLSTQRVAMYVDDWISQTLTSLQLQSVMFKQLSALSTETFPFRKRKPEKFSSVNDAKIYLDCILLDLYRLHALRDATPQYQCPGDLAWQNVQENLADWLSMTVKFTAFSKLDSLGQVACKLLKMYHTMGKILLGTCRDPTKDAAFENHTFDFMFIIEQGHDMYKIALQEKWHELSEINTTKASRGIADIGTIPPLYFTAINCRDAKLRMQAIRLLDCLSHREGIWDAELAASIASKVLQIESSNFVSAKSEGHLGMHATSEKLEEDVGHLAELKRVHSVDVILPDDPDGLVSLRCLRVDAKGKDQVIVNDFDLRSQQWI